ncbi:MAG: lipopolysaccharide biosynthesis protein [Coleofasciculaceae cyanobacterium]
MLINKLKQILSGQFIRNVGWMGAAELVNRIFRLGTTVTIARLFSPYDYGLAAVVYTTVEFANVFTLRKGIAAKVVQAEEQDLTVICDTSYWLNWILCVALFIIQCIAAFPIAGFYGDNRLILPVCTVASIYLMMPLFIVNSAIIQRENRLKITALCQVTQSIIGNIITVILALLGMGVWAIVWPMVLTTPVWIVITWMNNSWRPPKSFKLEKWQEVTGFGGNLLGVHLLDKLRSNLDYLIVGKFLGIDALGLYYFAFNAGFGISRNVISAFTSALFPYLCEVRGNIQQLKARYFSSLKKTFMIIVPFVLLQSGLSPFYVPIIFGEKWVEAIPILVLVCLSVIPFSLSIFTNDLLNSVDKTRITLYWNLIYTCLFTGALLVAVKLGILWVAAAVLICQLLMSPIFGIWAIRYVFEKKSSLGIAK